MNPTNKANGNKSRVFRTLLTVTVIVLILGVATAGGVYMIKSAPKAKRQKPLKEAPLVETMPLKTTLEQVIISATGTVIPAEEVELKSEVKGRVIAVKKSFELGSYLPGNADLLQLEPADYQLAVAQAESQVAEAAYNLAIELGNQEIARREWELYDNRDNANQNDKDLALRKPHLVKAQAAYKSAQAALTQAKLDLDRTIIFAPFNALVTAKNAEPGGYLAAQESVATLVNTDRYWVQVSIPVDRLQWIKIPQDNSDQGSTVQISAAGKTKVGKVHRLLADLSENGRMARILVEVLDPLDLKKQQDRRQPLILGEYVRVEIDGRMLDDVVSIPRSSLHDGNNVWLLDKQDRLQIAQADIIWRDSDQVLLKNSLPSNSRLITTNLATPVVGMQLRREAAGLALNNPSRGIDNE